MWSSPVAPPAGVSSSPEERRQEEPRLMHKVKVIDFLGRPTPIILQKDNGPCPLLAICNVLLLQNKLSLRPDISEVSQQHLLSLVADRIFISNLNEEEQEDDDGCSENLEQNIADAIDLLPRLATGIDVNTKFRRIDDFEFTRECAIFDLLNIPLYHGWIVDPLDYETANAIGSKSYNSLMVDLVALETQDLEAAGEEDIEEAIELLRVMKFSESITHSFPSDESYGDSDSDSELHSTNPESATDLKSQAYHGRSQVPCLDTVAKPDGTGNFIKDSEAEAVCLNTELGDPCGQSIAEESESKAPFQIDEFTSLEVVSLPSDTAGFSEIHADDQKVGNKQNGHDTFDAIGSTNAQDTHVDQPEGFLSAVDDSERIREAEESILLAEQGVKNLEISDTKEHEICPMQGQLIRDFLNSNASQLTIYGMFCLQEGLKEREVCVFFRNNHFNTMFKFEGELYILVTDLGYLNQPQLVWEKLNDTKGNTEFMTGNMEKFNVDDHGDRSLDVQNTVASSADLLSGIDYSIQEDLDLQYAMALQQQEYEGW
ncbi:OLC1v1010887C1 [Oldenlandia corymbosa var. corymbosa]|uniref:OLC1v1010887C1 n=1 Tax=Oldenlandia corymbosa var. corymbosa TaxID=529605 RepID=A0AAV1DV54_OLDCO|nr:OLC1v1010887C1 [Oldenlandia corymbosa var. corymbosa]